MANPIVVFVYPGRFGDALTSFICQSTHKMPAVGVKGDGTIKRANKCEEYSLLLLDDTKYPPANAPCQIDTKQPLLIVGHYNTEKNAGPWESLWGVNSPTACENFSHIDEDPVFVSIRNILRNKEEALKSFVQHYRNVDILQALNKLAAISQILFLTAKGGKLTSENAELLGTLREETILRCPIIDDADEFKKSNEGDQLKFLVERANPLLGFADGP